MRLLVFLELSGIRHKLGVFLFFTSLLVQAQTADPVKSTCGTEVPGQAWNDWFNAVVEESRKDLKKTQANYIIPVIFHVIHGGQPVGTFPNISGAQISSQINVLNNDYAGKGYNVNNFAGTAFSPTLIADCNITFCLAEKDTDDNLLPERGIDRVNYISRGWADPKSFTGTSNFKTFIESTVKPVTIWDAAHYLNIWISDVSSSAALLGYSTFPPGSGLLGIPGPGTVTDDGVWCWSMAVGDAGSLTPYYNRGRTLTHEIGHYLGLRHTWGDGTCATDYCNDTPPQQKENTGCPSYPHVTCNNGPQGDMFMNFMDYCYDACLYMFTNDQRIRMQSAMANSPLRKNLSVAKCGEVGIKETMILGENVELFPNPANGTFTLRLKGSAYRSATISIYTLLGESIFKTILDMEDQLAVDLSDQASGIYFVEIESGNQKIIKKLVLSE